MKCISAFLSLCLIAAFVVAQPNYDFSKLKREHLGRGVIAIRENPSTVAVSWRYLSSDSMDESFDVYRNGEKVNKHPIRNATFFQDIYKGTESLLYTVKAIQSKTESNYQLPSDAPAGYLNIPLNRPENGTTPAGQSYFYAPNDASIGDVDGDGEYEIILKWDPSNAHDNSHDGYTGEVYFDCYKLNGQHLWRINLGRNIRAGAHYTQFMVFDLDGDGKAEVVMKTADGTVDGKGKVIGEAQADYRNEQGRILTGPEYLTVFNGLTGEAMQTIDYVPGRGNLMDWGDNLKDPSLPVDELIRNYFDFIINKEYRLADGTFARNRPQHNTLWLDDMFMGIPAVAQMSYYDKEQKDKYLAEAVRQFLQFADRMFIPEKGLYRHGWVESSSDHPAFCWARANGWAMLTACELLDVLPEDYPQRAKVMEYFRAHVRGVTALQSGEGLWHQLLDRNDSYLETSATAIYVYCLAHAINKGWIDAIAYGPVAHLGWHAVAGKINAEGQVEGTCVGTGMAFDPAFYYYRPVNVYAAHGYGPVLWAGAEMIRLLKNQYPQMNDSAVQYYQVKQKTTAPIFAIDTEEKKD